MKDDGNTSDNFGAINPFELRKLHLEYAKKSGYWVIDLGRGDPDFPTHLRADWLHHLFMLFALKLRSLSQMEGLLSATFSAEQVRAVQAATIASFNEDTLLQQDAQKAFVCFDAIQQTTELSVAHFYALIACAVLGIHYGEPAGELFARSIIAERLNRIFPVHSEVAITDSEVVITAGAGEAIGAVFRWLVEAGLLKVGDKVGVISPVYSPYVHIVERLGLQTITLECLPENGFEPTDKAFAEFEDQAQSMKLLILVDPNNPTGRKLSLAAVKRLASFASAERVIVMIDAVYKELLADPCDIPTLFEVLPTQSLLIWSGSKAHRSTGLRFGAIAWTAEGERWLLDHVYSTSPGYALQDILVGCKALEQPLSHVTLVPLNAQLLGTLRLIMAEAEGPDYVQELWKRNLSFRRGLKLTHVDQNVFVPYYILFDLLKDVIMPRAQVEPRYAALANAMQQGAITPPQMLDAFAHMGVCLLYAAPFFCKSGDDHPWAMRVSVANQSAELIAEAAGRVSDCLDQMADEALASAQRGDHSYEE